jgi:transposase-like protein
MAYEEEKITAQLMYEHDHKNVKDIQKQLGVPMQTVYRWIKDGGWKQYRTDKVLNKFEAYKNFQDLLTKKFQEIGSQSGIAKEDLDILKGMIKTLSDMGKDIDRRGTILLGIEEFIKFMRAEHAEVVEEFIPYFNEFPKWISKQYPDAA